MGTIKTFTSKENTKIDIDVSIEACQRFNCEPGDRFTLLNHQKGIIIGTGPCVCQNCGRKIRLWVKIDYEVGVSYLVSSRNLFFERKVA